MSTTTKVVDVVARFRWNTDRIGRFDFTGPANFNETEVTKIPTTTQLSLTPPLPPGMPRLSDGGCPACRAPVGMS